MKRMGQGWLGGCDDGNDHSSVEGRRKDKTTAGSENIRKTDDDSIRRPCHRPTLNVPWSGLLSVVVISRLTMTLVGLMLLQLLFCLEPVNCMKQIEDPNFIFGDEKLDVVIYRLIGNDMPPLQERGQLRLNTKYTLHNEPHFPGARKRWILNRIWNETEFELLYRDLIAAGVNRRDIIVRCFDYNVYSSFPNHQEKLLYLTSQNEARNVGILDGRNSGFKWSVVLDGNTFITSDSWDHMKAALDRADAKGQHYVSSSV
jgi:hypothetical protein